ncbi:MAG: 16S rRNA (uracil(1498)-N(3))-methyltransferase [Bacteroidia bacterium]
MQVFYSSHIIGAEVFLDEEESLHLNKVLRLKSGESVGLIDGKGGLYEARVELSHNKHSKLKIEKLLEKQERKHKLHVAIAPTKSMERFEWFLEKAVELGIDRITPLISQRSERVILKQPRMEKIILSAMKQSRQGWMPQLDELVKLNEVLEWPLDGLKCIAHCGESERTNFLKLNFIEENTVILIGPEGDFTTNEITLAESKGYLSVSLGNSRLRTETAAIMACAALKIAREV